MERTAPPPKRRGAFARLLGERSGLPVHLQDERLTSVAAQRALHESGRDVRRGRPVIDQVAAQIILQSFLDARA